MWDLSNPGWEDCIREGRSLIPPLPLIRSEAKEGLGFFDDLCLPDVPDRPRLGDAAGQWFRDIVATSFGSWDPVTQQNFIRDIFVLAPKGSSKTSYGAGLALSVMLMNRRPRAEALFIGPTQAISDRAYEQAVGMIEASDDLKRRFRPRDHLKTIEDLVNQSEMKVKTFDLKILTGGILIFAHLDEVHLLGKTHYAAKVIRQIRGGIDKTPEGKFLITTTQSDDIPAGAFKDELHNARRHRDGNFRGKNARPTLAVMYEFPKDIAKEPARWRDTANWPMVMPNLGRSVHLATLVPDWNSEKEKGDQPIRVWASQYLNIEMGVGMKTDGWPGAEFWTQAEDEMITLETLLERCEVIIPGLDGGGLDDLFGLTLLGREKETKRWLSWSHAWCHKGVLERRQTIAAMLEQFAEAGELTIVDDKLQDLTAIVDIIRRVNDAGLLGCVAIDPEGPYGEFVDALDGIGITEEGEQIVGVPQGYKTMNAIKTTERKLANGTFAHAKSGLMDWCVGNVRIEPTATAIRATKQNAGDAKIDPWAALIDAATVMVRNPEPKRKPEFQMMFAWRMNTMKRAYSLLTLKAVDDEKRIITGIATTPTTDRSGDIVEPDGAEFKLPLPLLWQHDSNSPIGYVTKAKVTSAGIEIEAQIESSDEPGALKDLLDFAWGCIKKKLVGGLSIGFKEIESARIEQTYSYRYLKWLWLELSAVTIPANGEATIQTVKSIDAAQRAATGRKLHSFVRLDPPGASGKPKAPSKSAQEANDMKTLAEQITALETKRAANVALMETAMSKSIEGGRSSDESEQEEFDTLEAEVDAIDKDLKRLRSLEKVKALTAKSVIKVENEADGAVVRSGGSVVVKTPPKLPPGVAFARLAKVKAIGRLDNESAMSVAQRMYGADSEVVAVLKANEVTPGSNISGNWAVDLTGAQGSTYADFAAFLRPSTILGKFGVGGVPGLRKVPFREPLISQTGGGAGYWVGEGKPKPLTAFDFDRTTIEPLKCANIAVLTEENIRSSNPNSELIVRDGLRDALADRMDTDFVDPTNSGTSNVKPASITNGAAAIASTGTDAEHIRLDVRAVFQKFIDAHNPPSAGVFIMSSASALALSLMVNALGQREFPGITMQGGIFEGLPVIVSDYAGSIVVLVNASDIYEADDGDVSVDMSREASLEMKSASLSQDGSAGTGASLVSLWQNNLVGLRAERTINWKRRRASAVAYLTAVAWGGAVPAS